MAVAVKGSAASTSEEAGQTLSIQIDAAAHPISAVSRACYSLADLATFEVQVQGNSFFVRAVPIGSASPQDISSRLKTALIDFTVREEIESRTKGLRDLIWRTAFAETRGLVN